MCSSAPPDFDKIKKQFEGVWINTSLGWVSTVINGVSYSFSSLANQLMCIDTSSYPILVNTIWGTPEFPRLQPRLL